MRRGHAKGGPRPTKIYQICATMSFRNGRSRSDGKCETVNTAERAEHPLRAASAAVLDEEAVAPVDSDQAWKEHRRAATLTPVRGRRPVRGHDAQARTRVRPRDRALSRARLPELLPQSLRPRTRWNTSATPWRACTSWPGTSTSSSAPPSISSTPTSCYPHPRALAFTDHRLLPSLAVAPVLWATGNPVLATYVAVGLACLLAAAGGRRLARSSACPAWRPGQRAPSTRSTPTRSTKARGSTSCPTASSPSPWPSWSST